MVWDGTPIGHTAVLSNNLFDRLIVTNTNGFRDRLRQSWTYLRDNVLSNSELENMFNNNFLRIKNSDIIEIENGEHLLILIQNISI